MTDGILPSWRDGDTRDAILAFFDRVDEIPPAHRVAVFDNDGTMWAEVALLVNHDDAEREYAYESKAGTFDTAETILDMAARLGWTVASIRNQWATVFPDS